MITFPTPRLLPALGAVVAALAFASSADASPNPDGAGRSPSYAFGSVDADEHHVSANVASGNLTFTEADLPIKNTEGLRFSRTYNSLMFDARRDLGLGWTSNAGYDVRLSVIGSSLQLIDGTGHRVDFTPNGSGGYASSDASYDIEALTSGGWRVTVPPPGGTLTFSAQGLLTGSTAGDDALAYTYTSAGGQDRLSSIVDPGATNTRPSYNGDGSIIEIDDPSSDHFYYGYDGAKRLQSFTAANATYAAYGYDPQGRLNSASWSGGASATVTYDPQGRTTQIVGTSFDGNVDTTTFEYASTVAGCPALSVGSTKVTNSDDQGATYCWRADFTITKILPIDSEAPDADATGELVEASNDYAKLTSEQTVDLRGDDSGSGIRQLRLTVDGNTVATANATCDEGDLGVACPTDFDATVQYDPASLAQGPHTFAVVAVDDAGNSGQSEPWVVTVDRGAPSDSDDLVAQYLSDDDETSIQWSGDEDPELAPGTPGAGMGTWRYRYKRNSGGWSVFRTVDEPNATLPGGDDGDDITVQVTPSDLAGNAADESEVDATAEQVGSANATARRAGGISIEAAVQCEPDDDRTDLKVLPTHAGQTLIAIESNASITCEPTNDQPEVIAAFNLARVTFKSCPSHDDESLDCGSGKATGGRGQRTPIISKGKALCLPGTQPYRVFFRSTGFGNVAKEDIRGNTENFGCNEAGVWRRLSGRNGSPSAILGNRLPLGYNDANDPSNASDRQAIPPNGVSGERRGWAAHHLIMAGAKSKWISPAQGAAYACGIPPNGAVNGVWLRGPNLRYSSNRNKPYWDLSPSERQRDYHPSTHTIPYMRDVTRRIARFANPDGTCRSGGKSSIATALRGTIRNKLKNGDWTEGL